MLPPTAESPAVAAWVRVLDTILHNLGESLAIDPEASMPALPAVGETGVVSADGLTRLQASLARAEAVAADIDGGVEGETDALGRHLDGLRAAAQKLAERASRAV
jgi:hypothetical protein